MSNMMVLNQAKRLAENLSIEGDAKELIDTLKATAFKVKDGVVSDAQMAALMIVAQQYQLNPWLKQIYAYPDKQNGIVPVVGIDGWVSIIERHPQYDGMEFNYSDEMVTPEGGKPCPTYIECVIYRKDRTRATIVREYLDEVYKKPNFPSPWQTHTKRFLRHKALIQCARIAFGFGGIYEPDELDNEPTEKVINPLPTETQDFSYDLKNAKTLQELSAAWKQVPPSEKPSLLALKDEMKEKLMQSAVVATVEKAPEAKKAPEKEPDTTDWANLIENAKTVDELNAILKSMTPVEQDEWFDTIDFKKAEIEGM